MSDDEKDTKPVIFKTKKRANIRQRKKSSSDEEETVKSDEEDLNSKLEETKERQKLRKRQNGVNILGLAVGKKITAEEEVTIKDPFNTKSGGMVNMKALKSGKIKTVDDAYDTGIGTQFSAETNKRDEDEEMMKYIEDQLNRKKGVESDLSSEQEGKSLMYLSPEDAALFALPTHLRQNSSQRSEEMLSNQMLSGIPEIDLGIEAKIKNIEATEEAKLKLIQEQKNKKDTPSHFVPSNMAVNFVQHNRFKIDDNEVKETSKPVPEEKPNKSTTKGPKRATDDYHFDKFKKQFRRH
uniref:Hepatocellular carcinoma-associated antigen 59 n=1 Tax=Corethrella appendiculata TaxID=1370023 RepID=U5EZG7_9DIPT